MDYTQVIANFVATMLCVGGFLAWIYSRLDKKFDLIMSEIKEIRRDINYLTSRVDRLEVRLEERTLRVIHVQKKIDEQEAL